VKYVCVINYVCSVICTDPVNLALQAGKELWVGTDITIPASDQYLPVDFPSLSECLRVGDELFVGQYLFTGSETSSVYLEVLYLSLLYKLKYKPNYRFNLKKVLEIAGMRIRCRINNSCVLTGTLLIFFAIIID
jgi:hypothetical protein